MTAFYAKYPSGNPSSSSVTTVQGEGTAGTPVGGLLTVQGDPSGTPLPITGSITATNPSVGATGAAVPASGTYVAASVAGTLTGLVATANGLKVDGTATIQPVSGTVTANQGGTWTVQPGNTANTTPWLVTGSGTAGTAAAGVVTIQGIASMTAVKVDNSAVTQPANITQFGSNNVVTGTGTGGNGIPRVTVSSDSSLTSVGTVSTVTTVSTVSTVSTVTAVTAITNALPAGTNAIGSVISTATTAATFQAEGAIAFGSLTNVYATIFTPSASTKILQMRNNTNAAVSISFDAGTTTNYTLDAGDSVALDLVANGLIMTTTAIQAKYAVGAPTSGSVRVNGAH